LELDLAEAFPEDVFADTFFAEALLDELASMLGFVGVAAANGTARSDAARSAAPSRPEMVFLTLNLTSQFPQPKTVPKSNPAPLRPNGPRLRPSYSGRSPSPCRLDRRKR